MNNTKGKLIVIEGVDGSGKATQTSILYDRFVKEGRNVKKVEYPRYDSPSSSLVKMYLNGDFGQNAKEISPYIASTFYAVDRYASLKQDYEEHYGNGGIVIADRYATANMVHQAGKIFDEKERDKFLDWVWNLEFNMFGIPVPDMVFFLDIPIEFNQKLIESRENKDAGRKNKDIHEKDINHLIDSYNSALNLVKKYNWSRINCIKDGNLRTVEDIHNEVYNTIVDKLEI